jgi:HK97 family phage major capsid protein
MELKDIHAAMEAAHTKLAEGIKAAQDTAAKALETVRTEGTVTAEQAKALKELGEGNVATQNQLKELGTRLLEAEQKLARKPGAGNEGDGNERKTAGQLVIESNAYKEMLSRNDFKSAPVTIERKTIVNATLNSSQPLVQGTRLPGIVTPPQRRLTIRDLMPQIPTTSNLIEFARELVYTNSAAYQGATASPTGDFEGQPKAESQITFELATAAVVTIAHWIGASRQVMSDAPQLAGYIDSRLEYGLKLEEEGELLNGAGNAGTLDGLVTQATAFTGGATNQTALDTLLKAFLQVSLAEYEASGVVLHPTDWTNIMLLKDTTGRYLFSDPHSTEAPRVWGRNVVATQSMTQGQFLTGAFDLGAAIYDREGVSIRMSDQHDTFFIKNLVAILCEERLALVVYRPAAFITGGLSYAG